VVRVGPFALDRVPVTREAFAEFTRSHPEWRRDAEAAGGISRRRRVVARRESVLRSERQTPADDAEWERVANAGGGDVLAQYAARNAAPLAAVGKSRPNALGVANLHDLIWEWTLDFDGAPTHSEHAHRAARIRRRRTSRAPAPRSARPTPPTMRRFSARPYVPR
jgi:formylglycine-generating enzyme required for sulfatase activity